MFYLYISEKKSSITCERVTANKLCTAKIPAL